MIDHLTMRVNDIEKSVLLQGLGAYWLQVGFRGDLRRHSCHWLLSQREDRRLDKRIL